jgi:hypothetical protein
MQYRKAFGLESLYLVEVPALIYAFGVEFL